MHVNNVQKQLQYGEFFMSGGGKAHRGLGGTSQVDSIILGRDIDTSGEEPHKKFMSSFKDHAGVKSADTSVRPFRRPCYALQSTLDEVIWGRDFDKSGVDPHEHFANTYGGHAGRQAGDRVQRPFRKPVCSMQSTMDTIVLGRDIDLSGEGAYTAAIGEVTAGSAGIASGGRPERPFRKPGVSQQGVVDTIIWGIDIDKSGQDAYATMMANYGDHAGMTSGHAVDKDTAFRQRPFRKPGKAQVSVVGNILAGRDVDPGHHQEFAEKYAGYAGGLSIGRHEMRRIQRRGGAQSARLSSDRDMSRSSPALLQRAAERHKNPSARTSPRSTLEASPPMASKATPRSCSATSFDFKPAGRTLSDCGGPAGASERSTTQSSPGCRMPSGAQGGDRSGRRASTGSLTSRTSVAGGQPRWR